MVLRLKFLSIFFLTILSANAQMAVPTDATRADSLRGSLTPLRTCFDVKYYHLDVTVDPSTQGLKGSNMIFFHVVEPFNRFQIDLFNNLTIDKILFKGKELKFTREYDAVFVDFPEALIKGTNDSITVFYNGKPTVAQRAPWDGGFVWSKDSQGNPWVGVACEGLGASVWWPNKDHLSDEPDSMLISVTVPKNLMDVSNGRLRKQTDLNANWTKYDWFVSNPINNYNVTVNIGNYTHWSDSYINGDTLTLDYYVLPENLARSKKQFEQVKPMLKIFEKYLGKYPFYKDGYKLVETSYLGMEHQSAIAYGNNYKPGYAGMDYSRIGLDFDYIIIHESGHEWWGNNVGCADLADMWINEGFCTYIESLYVESLFGPGKAKDYVNVRRKSVGNREPVMGPYGINREGNKDMYDKGALILYTLRNVINDDTLWFEILKGIQKDFALKTVSERDIVDYINRKTGKDYNYFFDQYLKYPAIPVLEIKTEKKKKTTVVQYRWNTDVTDFQMPLRLSGKNKTESTITPSSKWQDLSADFNKEDLKMAKDLYYIEVKEVI
jgi:aminopeptidase N